MSDVDVVVIGSGAGGLTAAVALARAGKKVLVLEQHYLPGGWCHSFDLGGFQFSPGVHYLGELGEGGQLRETYEGLGVSRDLSFLELNPDGFDHVIVGDDRFDIPKGKEVLIERLQQRFPTQARGIEKYFARIDCILRDLRGLQAARGLKSLWKVPFVAPNLLFHGLRPLSKLLDRCIDDPLLRTILTIQAGDYGLPSTRVPAVVHASVVAHYYGGGFYPRGGARSIPRAFIRELKRHDGDIRVRAPVAEILLDGGAGRARARGVRLQDGTTISCKHVISNADPGVTFGQLIPAEMLSSKLRRRVQRTRWSLTCVSLFAAVDSDLEAVGLDSGNYWVSQTPSTDLAYRRAASGAALEHDQFSTQFVTFTTLKDRAKRKDDGPHTLESFGFVPYDAFQRWTGTGHGQRGGDYEALKQRLQDMLLSGLDRLQPGLSEKIVFAEIGTPLTNSHFLSATRGNLYGTEKSLWEIGPFAYPLQTEIKGLMMCGASTLAHGVAGATYSGLQAAAQLLQQPADTLLQPTEHSLSITPADAPISAQSTPQKVAVEQDA